MQLLYILKPCKVLFTCLNTVLFDLVVQYQNVFMTMTFR